VQANIHTDKHITWRPLHHADTSDTDADIDTILHGPDIPGARDSTTASSSANATQHRGALASAKMPQQQSAEGVRRRLSSMVTVSDERIRRSVVELEQLERLLVATEEQAHVQWGRLLGLRRQRKLLAREHQRQSDDAARLRSLLYRSVEGTEGVGGAGGELPGAVVLYPAYPLSMVAPEVVLEDAPLAMDARGPLVQAVLRGGVAGRRLTRGGEEVEVLDEIVEVDGRGVRGLGWMEVMDLLTDAPGTRSIIKVQRDDRELMVEVRRPPHIHDSASEWRASMQEGLQVQCVCMCVCVTETERGGKGGEREADVLITPLPLPSSSSIPLTLTLSRQSKLTAHTTTSVYHSHTPQARCAASRLKRSVRVRRLRDATLTSSTFVSRMSSS
jgi:hypothetical protein